MASTLELQLATMSDFRKRKFLEEALESIGYVEGQLQQRDVLTQEMGQAPVMRGAAGQEGVNLSTIPSAEGMTKEQVNALSSASFRDLAGEAGQTSRFASVPEVQSFVESEGKTFSPGGAGGTSVFEMQEALQSSPALSAENEQTIQTLLENQTITESEANSLRAANKNAALRVRTRLVDLVGRVAGTGASGRVQTDVLKGREEELRDPKVQTAEEIASARAAAKIETDAELADVKAEVESTVSGAKAYAAETKRMEAKYANAAKGLYDVTGAAAEVIPRAVNAIDAMLWMADEIENGNVGAIALTGIGQFTDPQVSQRAEVIQEYYARPLSGAAINAKEWDKFNREVLTPALMLTNKGKATATRRLRELARNHKVAGALLTKDENWLDSVRGISDPTREDGGPTGGFTAEKQSELDALLGGN